MCHAKEQSVGLANLDPLRTCAMQVAGGLLNATFGNVTEVGAKPISWPNAADL
jgi:hypothetical protein